MITLYIYSTMQFSIYTLRLSLLFFFFSGWGEGGEGGFAFKLTVRTVDL